MIQMSGYAVEDQVFAVVDSVTPGLLSTPVSGLMGLAFRGIATSGGTPFWSRIAATGLWDKPLMSFCLTKLVITLPASLSVLIPFKVSRS